MKSAEADHFVILILTNQVKAHGASEETKTEKYNMKLFGCSATKNDFFPSGIFTDSIHNLTLRLELRLLTAKLHKQRIFSFSHKKALHYF